LNLLQRTLDRVVVSPQRDQNWEWVEVCDIIKKIPAILCCPTACRASPPFTNTGVATECKQPDEQSTLKTFETFPLKFCRFL
jgi:hypothetical protein